MESSGTAVPTVSQARRAGKQPTVITAAIARELAGFIWAIAKQLSSKILADCGDFLTPPIWLVPAYWHCALRSGR
jgi:hypothetical protein